MGFRRKERRPYKTGLDASLTIRLPEGYKEKLRKLSREKKMSVVARGILIRGLGGEE